MDSTQKRVEVVTWGYVTEVTFAEKISALVEQSKEPAATFAKRAGLNATAISNIINDGTTPGVTKALAIARAFGVSLEWLADDSKGWPPERPTELNQVTSLLTDEQRTKILELASEYEGFAACLAAACEVLLAIPEPERETALLRMARKKLKAARPQPPPPAVGE